MPTRMDRVLRAVGRELAAERVRRGYKQKDISDLTDNAVTARQVGKIERGEAGQFEEAFQVADALGVSLARIIADAEKAIAQEDAGEDAPRMAQGG